MREGKLPREEVVRGSSGPDTGVRERIADFFIMPPSSCSSQG